MKRWFLYTTLFFFAICRGQDKKDSFALFTCYATSLLQDTTNFYRNYPTPPLLTDNVLIGLKKEFSAKDSIAYYLKTLQVIPGDTVPDYEKAFTYFENNKVHYTLLSLSVHFNPDIRIAALRKLNDVIKLRPSLSADKKNKLQKQQYRTFDKSAIKFLIYLVENTPLFISGDENATIHAYYISNILWNLDLLTQQEVVKNVHFGKWYKNPEQLKQAIAQWKAN